MTCPRRLLILALVLIGLSLILVKAVALGQVASRVLYDYEALRPFMTAGPGELIQTPSLLRLEALLSRSETDLRDLRREVAPFFGIALLFNWVPMYGGELAQAPALLDYAVEAAASGQILLRTYRSVVDQIPIGSELSKNAPRGQVLLRVLGSTHSGAEELGAQLARTAMARQQIDVDRLSPGVGRLIDRGDSILNLAGPALRALDVLPDMLGEGQVRRYLIVAQNNDELRATGGYISGLGILEIKDGEITQVKYQDSYAVENYGSPHPWPPKPLTDYMGAEQWTVRDANWSPDFPTTAREIEKLYELNQNTSIDGVVAVNLNAVIRLVGALGPIDMPAYGERVDGQNVRERMEHYFLAPAGVAQGADWWSHRKDFMAALVQAIVARLNGANGAVRPLQIGQALWASLAAKDILIYVNDTVSAGVFHDLYWDGALPAVRNDVVLAVDSNVGWNKADPKIDRRMDYRIDLKPGERAAASLHIRYQNTNPRSSQPCIHEPKYEATYAEMQNMCYWDYVRLYVPPGSRPVSATGGISATLESPELGYSVFSGYFMLPRGETRDIRFDYELPFSGLAVDGASKYRLEWIRQPGAAPAAISVMLVFPDSFRLSNAKPAPVSQSGSTAQFALDSDRDAAVEIVLVNAEGPSRRFAWGLVGGVVVASAFFYWKHRAHVSRVVAESRISFFNRHAWPQHLKR